MPGSHARPRDQRRGRRASPATRHSGLTRAIRPLPAETLVIVGSLLRSPQSVGRTGICYDNAMAESFFATLKNERVHRTVYPTRQHARADIAQYIELRYNTRRIHSGLGYRTPQEV